MQNEAKTLVNNYSRPDQQLQQVDRSSKCNAKHDTQQFSERYTDIVEKSIDLLQSYNCKFKETIST